MIVAVGHVDILLPVAKLVLRALTMPLSDILFRRPKESGKSPQHAEKKKRVAPAHVIFGAIRLSVTDCMQRNRFRVGVSPGLPIPTPLDECWVRADGRVFVRYEGAFEAFDIGLFPMSVDVHLKIRVITIQPDEIVVEITDVVDPHQTARVGCERRETPRRE